MEKCGKFITVKGKGSASAVPDWIKITLSLKAKSLDYEKTVNLAAKQLEQLRNSLKEHDFDKKDIKTIDFNLDTSYENLKDKNGNYDRVFKGYICVQDLYIGFEAHNKKLGEILNSLSHCKSKPKFSIKYELKDETKPKEEVLKNAIINATDKAKVISNAANVNLGEIIRINYDWNEVKFIRDFEFMDSMAESSIASLDIEPDDIKASDTITVIWEIK